MTTRFAQQRRQTPRVQADPPRRAGWPVIALGAVLVVVALVVAVTGMTLTQRHHREVVETTQVDSATLDGLSAAPGTVIWAAMQEDQSMGATGGYQMPPQMMPGMPTGDTMRLGVNMTLANTGSTVQTFDLNSEFFVGGGKIGPPRPLQVDSFGGLPRLNGESVVRGVLYFDIKPPAPGDPPLYVLWKRAGQQRRLTIHVPAAMQMTDAPPNGTPTPSSPGISE
jgi:hypothetical protein